jgi:serralysin
MRIRTLVAGLAVGATALLATASTAGATSTPATGTERTIWSVVDASGNGFDRRGWDYDVLEAAVRAAGLDGALAAPGGLTVFAPNDAAFVRTARALGYTGWDEAGAFGHIAGALDGLGGEGLLANLTEILTYHVAPSVLGPIEVLLAGSIPTLQGSTIGVDFITLRDNDPLGLRDPRLTLPINVRTSNGVIHTIDRVLIPADILS